MNNRRRIHGARRGKVHPIITCLAAAAVVASVSCIHHRANASLDHSKEPSNRSTSQTANVVNPKDSDETKWFSHPVLFVIPCGVNGADQVYADPQMGLVIDAATADGKPVEPRQGSLTWDEYPQWLLDTIPCDVVSHDYYLDCGNMDECGEYGTDRMSISTLSDEGFSCTTFSFPRNVKLIEFAYRAKYPNGSLSKPLKAVARF